MQPLFIVSLPRSGSTLLQRMLSRHPQIATTAEPWFLLPLVYSLRDYGAWSEYGHSGVVMGLSDLAEHLPSGERVYWDGVRGLAMSLYGAMSTPATRYFLDKTPRYHLILSELKKIFSDARFVILLRNPLDVVASITKTYGRGRWCAYRFYVDLYAGLASIASFVETEADRGLVMHYEELVRNPEAEFRRLLDYLELDHYLDEPTLPTFSSLGGRLGDSAGSKKYKDISPQSIGEWRGVLSTPFRRWWTRRYLNWIGADRLGCLGYDHAGLGRQVVQQRTSLRFLFSDVIRHVHGLRLRRRQHALLRGADRHRRRRMPRPYLY